MQYEISSDVINTVCTLWAHFEVEGFDVMQGTDSHHFVFPL